MKTIKAKVIMLPTNDKPTKGSILLRHLWKDTKLECRSVWQYNETKQLSYTAVYTTLNGSFMDAPSSFKSQHAYLTTDEEIKENFKGYAIVTVKDDPRIKYVVNCICTERNQVYCLGDRKFSFEFYSVQKVVATTDTSLGFGDEFGGWYPLPQIPQEFLKEYCETDGKIDEVEIEIELSIEKNGVQRLSNEGVQPEDLPNCVFENKIKTDSNNCIIISKSKDSWSKKEVIKILKKFEKYLDEYPSAKTSIVRMDNWFKDNL